MGGVAHTVIVVVEVQAFEKWHRQGAVEWAGEWEHLSG